MDTIVNNLLSNIPVTLVFGYFAKQFINRLEKYIDKTDEQERRVIKLELTNELKDKFQHNSAQ